LTPPAAGHILRRWQSAVFDAAVRAAWRELVGDHQMVAMGSLLVGVGILLAGLLALLFRHPRAPRWCGPEMVAMLAVVPVTVVLGFGLGYVLVGAQRLLNGAGELYELAALVGVALLVAGWVLHVRRRLQAYGAASAAAGLSVNPAATPTLMAEGPPGPTPGVA
jgi:hypothetical protein